MRFPRLADRNRLCSQPSPSNPIGWFFHGGGSFLTLLHQSTLPCTCYELLCRTGDSFSGSSRLFSTSPWNSSWLSCPGLSALVSSAQGGCRAPPGFPSLGCGLETHSRRRDGVVSSLTSFVFCLSGILLLCGLIPSVLKNCSFTSFVWILSCFK